MRCSASCVPPLLSRSSWYLANVSQNRAIGSPARLKLREVRHSVARPRRGDHEPDVSLWRRRSASRIVTGPAVAQCARPPQRARRRPTASGWRLTGAADLRYVRRSTTGRASSTSRGSTSSRSLATETLGSALQLDARACGERRASRGRGEVWAPWARRVKRTSGPLSIAWHLRCCAPPAVAKSRSSLCPSRVGENQDSPEAPAHPGAHSGVAAYLEGFAALLPRFFLLVSLLLSHPPQCLVSARPDAAQPAAQH